MNKDINRMKYEIYSKAGINANTIMMSESFYEHLLNVHKAELIIFTEKLRWLQIMTGMKINIIKADIGILQCHITYT